jgi:ArsR family transcriptional regulator
LTARRAIKTQLLGELSQLNRALGTPARIELLELLAQTERSVEVLANLAGLSVANASQHLRVLKRSGLVASRRDGQFVYYRLAGDEIVRLIATLYAVAVRTSPNVERLIEAYRESSHAVQPMTAAELAERLREGLVTVVDVRPREEYAAGHIPGALSVPLGELEGRLGEIPADREVVAYCRGVLCIQATEAVAALQARGLQARRLEFGLPEWRSAGLPVTGT